VPADPSNPENWNRQNKLAVVIETVVLNEEELAEYCRRKGLYAEQIAPLAGGGCYCRCRDAAAPVCCRAPGSATGAKKDPRAGNGAIDAAYLILSLMVIELWCRRFIDDTIPTQSLWSIHK